MKLFTVLVLAFYFCMALCTVLSSQPYKAIFNFGDSLSDTGNYLLSGAPSFPAIGNLPYMERPFSNMHPADALMDDSSLISLVRNPYILCMAI